MITVDPRHADDGSKLVETSPVLEAPGLDSQPAKVMTLQNDDEDENWDYSLDQDSEETNCRGLCIQARCRLDNGNWAILQLLVDTGAENNVIRTTAIPTSMHRPLNKHLRMCGVDGEMMRATHEVLLKLQFDVGQTKTGVEFMMETPAPFAFAPLVKNCGLEGILSCRWLAQR